MSFPVGAWMLAAGAVFARRVGLPLSSGSMFQEAGLGPDTPAAFSAHAAALFWAFVIWAAALLMGRALLKLGRMRGGEPWETAALSAGLGLGSISSVFFLFGAARLLTPAALGVVLAGFAAAALWINRDLPACFAVSWPRSCVPETMILCMLAALAFVQAAGPEFFFDSLVYHLALPKLYLLEGRLVPVAHNVYAGFPMAIEFFYGVGLAAGGEAAARMLSWGLGLAVIGSFLAAAGAGRRRAGAAAALIFFSTPFIGAGWGETGVDHGVAFFTLLSVLSGSRLLRAAPGESAREAVLCGLMIGGALASKMTVWGLLPGGLAALWTLLPTSDRRIRARLLTIVAASAACVLLPWLIKNLIFYGNPLFPFFHDTIAGVPLSQANWRRLRVDASAVDIRRALSSAPAFWAWISGFGAGLTAGFSSLRANFSGPLYIAFVPWIALSAWKTPESRLSARTCAALFLFWLFSTSMLRLFAPGLALLALLAALCVYESQDARWLKNAGRAAVLLFGVAGAAWFGSAVRDQGMVLSFFGLASRDALLSVPTGHYPYPSYLAYRALNKNLASGRVLVLGDSRGYYLERPFIAASVMNESPFIGWIVAAPDASALAAELRRQNVTGFVFNLEGYFYTKDAAPLMIPREKIPLFKEFWERWLDPLWVSGAVAGPGRPFLAAYRVRSSPVERMPLAETGRPIFPFGP